MRQYYGLWLKRAFCQSLGPIDLWIGLLSAIFGVADHYLPSERQLMGALVWQVPIWAAAGVFLVRLVLAPYWLYREKLNALEKAQVIKVTRANLGILTEMRENAIHDLLVRRINSESDFEKFKQDFFAWNERVMDFLREHFPRHEGTMFDPLGEIPADVRSDEPHPMANHFKRLVVLKLRRLQEILNRPREGF